MKWNVLSSEYLFRHEPYVVLRKDVCSQPNGKIVPAYYVAELPPCVIIFPVVNNKVVMIKQYRHPVEEVLWELPGGFIEKDELPEKAAIRELIEETGYSFSSVTFLSKTAANPGILNNYTYLFFAEGEHEITGQQPDDNEDIEIGFFSFEELKEMIFKNEIIQSMHLNVCFLALLHLGKLQFTY